MEAVTNGERLLALPLPGALGDAEAVSKFAAGRVVKVVVASPPSAGNVVVIYVTSGAVPEFPDDADADAVADAEADEELVDALADDEAVDPEVAVELPALAAAWPKGGGGIVVDDAAVDPEVAVELPALAAAV